MLNLQGDFHIHTPFCPHGSSDQMEEYVVKAIDRGLKYLSFTEHAPLPAAFVDPAPGRDSAMNIEDVETYFTEGQRLKEKYKDQISIKIGFEVDYLIGYEEETSQILNQYGPMIEDSILSVHMLVTPDDQYVCMDYSSDEFARIIKLFGSIDQVYRDYYQTLLRAIQADLGPYKPQRIGHITLIEKFAKRYPAPYSYDAQIDQILAAIQEKNYALDVNTAGFYKELCGVSYPPVAIIDKAIRKKIPLIFGSDSHAADHVGRGVECLPDHLQLSLPRCY